MRHFRLPPRIFAILGYCAAYGGSFLLMFQDNLSVPSSGVRTPEDGTDRLSHNIVKELPLYAV